MVYSYIGGNMKKKIKNDDNIQKSFSTSETILLVIMASIVSYFIGHTLVDNKTTEKVVRYDPYIQEFADNYNYIVNNYYEQVDRQDLINKAISGMLESLDEYSVYIDEEESDNFNITLTGSYQGIGVQIIKDDKTGYIYISSVFNNSPASEAGLKAGDYIISINNLTTIDMEAAEFSKKVRESNETVFNIKILRNGKEQDIQLNRKEVVIDSFKES